ncbi:hypothetical protein K2X85_15795 [bacterium]|jgi:hypothetical protein|nr:hypothetical protein [bacterium]
MIGWWIAGGVVLLIAPFAYVALRRMFRDITTERALELFHLQREMLEAKFLELGRSLDHPKGLVWADGDFEGEARFARHRRTGELVAFVDATIYFALPESAPSDPQQPVGSRRQSTAIFLYKHGHWGTLGRSLFDMTPEEALEQYRADYEPILATEQHV